MHGTTSPLVSLAFENRLIGCSKACVISVACMLLYSWLWVADENSVWDKLEL